MSKYFAVALLTLTGISPLLAGPERLPDSSKGKEVQMVQQPVCDPRWYFSVGGGADFDIGNTDVQHAFRRDFIISTEAGPAIATAMFRSANWNDVYNEAYHIQGEIGYVLTHHLEVFGQFKYSHADATDRISGSSLLIAPIFFPFTLTVPLSTELGDYSAWGGELGFRFFFLSKEARFRPYLAFSGGATHVDSIDAVIRQDISQFGGPRDDVLYRGGFFDDSWVGTAAATLGLEFNVACHWSLGVEGGVRYQSRLDTADSKFRGLRFIDSVAITPLQPFRDANNDAGDRWTVPVTGYVKFRF